MEGMLSEETHQLLLGSFNVELDPELLLIGSDEAIQLVTNHSTETTKRMKQIAVEMRK